MSSVSIGSPLSKYTREISDFLNNSIKDEYSQNARHFLPKLMEKIDQIATNLIDDIKKSAEKDPSIYKTTLSTIICINEDLKSILIKIMREKYNITVTSTSLNKNYTDKSLLGNYLEEPHYKYEFSAVWYPDHPVIYKKKEPEYVANYSYSPANHLKKEWKAAKEKKATDITINVGDMSFGAHKIKLLCHSEYFDTILNNPNSEEAQKGTFTIPECPPAIFQSVLKFIYKGTIGKKAKTDLQTVVDILQQANRFRVKELVNECTATLAQLLQNAEMSDASFIQILEFSCETIEKELTALCLSKLKNKKLLAKVVTKDNWNFLMSLAKERKYETAQAELTRCAEYNPALFQFLPQEDPDKALERAE